MVAYTTTVYQARNLVEATNIAVSRAASELGVWDRVDVTITENRTSDYGSGYVSTDREFTFYLYDKK